MISLIFAGPTDFAAAGAFRGGLGLLATFAVALFLGGCDSVSSLSGEGGDGGDIPADAQRLELYAAADRYEPMSIVTIPLANSATQTLPDIGHPPWEGRIGDEPVMVSLLTYGSQGAFLLPNLKPGVHELEFLITPNAVGVVEIRVEAPPEIADPAAIVAAQIEKIGMQYADLERRMRESALSASSVEHDLEVLRKTVDELESHAASASADEIRDVATFITVNPELFEPPFAGASAALRTGSALATEEALEQNVKRISGAGSGLRFREHYSQLRREDNGIFSSFVGAIVKSSMITAAFAYVLEIPDMLENTLVKAEEDVLLEFSEIGVPSSNTVSGRVAPPAAIRSYLETVSVPSSPNSRSLRTGTTNAVLEMEPYVVYEVEARGLYRSFSRAEANRDHPHTSLMGDAVSTIHVMQSMLWDAAEQFGLETLLTPLLADESVQSELPVHGRYFEVISTNHWSTNGMGLYSGFDENTGHLVLQAFPLDPYESGRDDYVPEEDATVPFTMSLSYAHPPSGAYHTTEMSSGIPFDCWDWTGLSVIYGWWKENGTDMYAHSEESGGYQAPFTRDDDLTVWYEEDLEHEWPTLRKTCYGLKVVHDYYPDVSYPFLTSTYYFVDSIDETNPSRLEGGPIYDPNWDGETWVLSR